MAGPWEKYANPSTRYGADPYKVAEEQRKQQAADLAQQAADRANNNSVTANANSAKASALAEKKLAVEMAKEGLMFGPDGSIIKNPNGPVVPPKGGAADTQKLANLRALERQIAEVRGLYNRDLKGGNVLDSITETLPLAQNRAFDSAGKALAETGFGAFRVPGVGSQSDAEGARFVEAYAPSASDYDSVIEQKITNLENRLRDTYREMGIEPRQADEQPLPVAGNAPPAQGADRSAPLPVGPSFGSHQGDPSGFVPYGSTTRRVDNPEWKGVNDAVKGMIIAGQSPDAIRAYLGERGINTNVEGLNQAADYFRKTGKRDFRVNVDDIEVPMSGVEQFRNNAPQTRLGTAAAAFGNAAGLGVPQALAPEQMQYLRDQNPVSAFAGDVGGIVGATSAIGKVGANLASRAAPQLLSGGGKIGNAARAIAPDAVYGAGYGAVTEGDPLTGAVTAAAGSGAGQLLGKGAQKLFQGARLDPNAQVLRNAGMQNLTIGQSLGGFAKSLEDAGTSAPILGDIINARRAEGLQEFNLGRLNEAGAPIGATVTETGEDGLNQLMSQVGSAYDNATAGVNVPLDPQFAADMQAAAAAGRRLPPDYQVRFDKIGENRVGPIFDAGQMTGETYQQAMRGLKGARSSAGQAAPGFEQDYRDAVTLAMGALRGQMERGGGQNVIDGLAQADTANRLGKTLQNAMSAAKNDAGGAGVQIFTPAQLNTAAYAAQKKFPGPRPFADMTDAAQMVLPSKIPDSGTARRGASLLLPVSLGGTGAGLDYYLTQTPGEGGAAGLAAGALLLAGGSKGGQKALDKLLFKRPDAVRKVGGIFGRRKLQKGLGASVVTAPLLIEQ